MVLSTQAAVPASSQACPTNKHQQAMQPCTKGKMSNKFLSKFWSKIFSPFLKKTAKMFLCKVLFQCLYRMPGCAKEALSVSAT